MVRSLLKSMTLWKKFNDYYINKAQKSYGKNLAVKFQTVVISNSYNTERFEFKNITTPKIATLLKNIDKKTSRTDKIPPKLVK